MKLRINPLIFNKLYFHLLKALQNEDIRFITIYGGSSSSKSYSIIQSILFQCLIAESSNTMVLRKYGADIRDSVYSDFKGQINDYNLRDLIEPQINLLKCSNGAQVRFRGLDDAEKIKGLATFKRVFLEEITQFDEEDLKQVRKRLRGRAGQQIIAAFNPISEDHWIKTKFIDTFEWIEEESDLDENSFIKRSTCGSHLLIKTTYLDNYWVTGRPERPKFGFHDVHTIKDFERDKIYDYNYYRIYALGEFGQLTTGAELYKSFNETTHVKKHKLENDRALWLSFDENVLPYITLTIWQGDSAAKVLHQVGEIMAEPPKNTLKDLLDTFVRQYPDKSIPIKITGDRTSKKADVKLEKGQNFFRIIENRLIEEGYKVELRLPTKNPSVIDRVRFINEMFIQNPRVEARVYLNENSPKTIKDVKYCPEAADGTKLKKKVKNPSTGQTYEEYGHGSDTLDYVVCEFFKDEYKEFLTGGKKALVKTYRKRKKNY